MTEQDAIQTVISSAPWLDTFLNITVFIFVGILVWLCTSAPVRGDLEDGPTPGIRGGKETDRQA